VLPAIEAKYRELNSLGAFQIGGFLTYGKIDKDRRGQRHADRRSRRGVRGYFEANGKLPARSPMEHHQLAPGRHRQDRHPALRHHPRRPPAQLRQCRADHPRQLCLDRRLGVPGPARRRRQKQIPIALPAIDARLRLDDPCLGGKVELRPTASPSCASTARTRSAPSPARAGTCAG
jgi:LPS-assembly protein